MADEVESTTVPLDIDKVEKVFELNDTLDDMVRMIVGMVAGAIAPLPSGFAKNAFMTKLQRAIGVLAEEVAKGK